ncbi:MAG: rod shape-determining protein [Deltaproteobacteria bacterium]|nr:rod shape-determining protein [Deltaproteobacteria bacterium]
MARQPAELAIDLGSSYTRIALRGRGVVLEEPTVVATELAARGREVVAVGTEAREMIGRTPAGISVVRPVRHGVVADFEATERLLERLLSRVVGRSIVKPRVLVCIPAETTEVQRRAVQDATRAAGAREVWLMPGVLAAAIGAELPVSRPVGSLVVDTGGGRTEAGVISLGGLVVRRSVAVGGDEADEAIANWARDVRGVTIGERTAEAIKLRVGAALAEAGEERGRPLQMRVRGRDIQSGSPREIDVSSSDVAEALSGVVSGIRHVVLETLRETPPELAADIVDRGLILCGGGAALRGLDMLLRTDTGLPVLRADEPPRCTARGAGLVLDDAALFARVVGPA